MFVHENQWIFNIFIFFTFEHFSFCTFALVRVLRGITNGFDHFQNACVCFFMKSPAKLTKSQNACCCSAVGDTWFFCRTSNGFLTFFFARRKSAGQLPKSHNPFFMIFSLSKCCCGPHAARNFDEMLLWTKGNSYICLLGFCDFYKMCVWPLWR